MKSIALRGSQLVLALVAAGVIGGAGVQLVSTQQARATSSPPAVSATAMLPAAQTASAIVVPDFSDIVSRHGAAVVNISVVGPLSDGGNVDSGGPAAQSPPEPNPDDPLFEFFRRFGPPGSTTPDGPPAQPSRGQGSGFIVSADGLILTNAHVVRDASEVTVKLTDRREFVAKVLGTDAKTDVALLRIAAKGLPVVPLGAARDLRVGEWVLAIGSPFGLENSVSAGVVSAKGRSLPNDSMVPFIQTDVAVNPGNSGGPLFNARGEVVGINSQIYTRTGGYQGLSFAIPMETVLRVKDQIVATGQASHARLGVAVQSVNQTLADSFQLERPLGALVSSVEPGGPADKAGLRVGDVVQRLGDRPVLDSGDLPAMVGQALPGERTQLGIWRQSKAVELAVQLGDANDKVATAVAQADPVARKGWLGLALRPLSPGEQHSIGISGGLLVERVQQGPAALAGLQRGDVLLAINGAKVTDIAQLQTAVAHAKKSIALLIQRDGDQIFVPVRLN
jgi:serine protease Do